MKRKLIDKLAEWKQFFHTTPVLLIGARGVGKTFLAYDFAKSFYSQSIYINFEREPYLYDLFDKNNSLSIEDKLRKHFHLTGSSEPVLLILDEIFTCPEPLSIIKTLQELTQSYDVIGISSNYSNNPVVDKLFYKIPISPLDFEEFLTATGNEWYIEVIKFHYNTNQKLPEIVHQELLAIFDDYLHIGGMPLAVNEYLNTGTQYNVSDQHRILINSYLMEVHQRNIDGDALKINQVFSTIDKQLMKANRKFQYTLIRKGATQAIYTDSIQYLQDTFYCIRCNRIGDPFLKQMNGDDIKLHNDYTNVDDVSSGFKLYMADVGLLFSTINTHNSFLEDSIRKGILENYVAQCLTSNGYTIYFWESNSQAKIDFIISKDDYLLPIEVRVDQNTRSKNVSVLKQKCDKIKESIKISTKNFEYINQVKYVPIYAVFCI